jgi:uncharacterized protein
MFPKPSEKATSFDPRRLLTAAAFPHQAPSLHLIETHISWVVLTGLYAYKIKKPIQLPFVDYSTLELRRHFCEFELELNRELAPAIYLDVVKITGPATHPSINGNEAVIEYAVQMNEFEQSDIMAFRLESGLVTAEEIDRLAELIAAFHRRVPRASATASFGTPDRVRQDADDNFSAFRSIANEDQAGRLDWQPSLTEQQRDQLVQLRGWTDKEYKRCETWLLTRHAHGIVRRCHGDMHTGNIVLFKNRIEIFDRIEFNEDFQWIDCLNELAFPVMDLFHYGRPDLANRLLNEYLERTGDYDGLTGFRFYLVYRSMVRAKVEWIRHQQALFEGRERGVVFKSPFLKLALDLSWQPERFLYITHGLSGSGKSTAAKHCVEQTGAVCIRSDVVRERMVEKHSAAEKYSADLRGQVYNAMLKTAATVLEAGFSVVVDATFLRRADRQKFHDLANRVGVPFGIIDCQAPVDELERRIQERKGDASEATVAVLHDQIRTQDALTQEELECRCLSGTGTIHDFRETTHRRAIDGSTG